MPRLFLVSIISAFAAAAPAPAVAQSVGGFVRLGVLLPADLPSITRIATFEDQGSTYVQTVSGSAAWETARLTGEYDYTPSLSFDVSGGVRVGRYVGGGITLTQSTMDVQGRIEAETPHPFFFDRPRAGSLDFTPASSSVQALHLSGVAFVPVGVRFELSVFAGPSRLATSYEFATDASFAHEYPYDTIGLTEPVKGRQSVEVWGFHAGADASVYFTSHLGAGATVRYSSYGLPLPVLESLPGQDVDLSRLELTAGLRLRF